MKNEWNSQNWSERTWQQQVENNWANGKHVRMETFMRDKTMWEWNGNVEETKPKHWKRQKEQFWMATETKTAWRPRWGQHEWCGSLRLWIVKWSGRRLMHAFLAVFTAWIETRVWFWMVKTVWNKSIWIVWELVHHLKSSDRMGWSIEWQLTHRKPFWDKVDKYCKLF